MSASQKIKFSPRKLLFGRRKRINRRKPIDRTTMSGNKQPHNSLIYILPVHYYESNSVRIRVPRPMRSARVSRSGCGKGGAILRPVSGQPPIDSPPPHTASRRRFNSRTKKASGGRCRSYNSRARIGPVFRITHEPAVSSTNPVSLGGS